MFKKIVGIKINLFLIVIFAIKGVTVKSIATLKKNQSKQLEKLIEVDNIEDEPLLWHHTILVHMD